MVPVTLLNSVVRDSPVQVRPVVVVQAVSIESLPQQVRTFWGEVGQVRVLLRGGDVPPVEEIFYGYPPRGPSYYFLLLSS